MKVVNTQWTRDIECVYCGALLKIEASDVKVHIFDRPRESTGQVTKDSFYISCPIQGCEKDTILEKVPTSIQWQLVNERLNKSEIGLRQSEES